MTHHDDDRRLKELFAAARRADEVSAPGFDSVRRGERAAERPRRFGSRGFRIAFVTAAAGAAIAAAAVWLGPEPLYRLSIPGSESMKVTLAAPRSTSARNTTELLSTMRGPVGWLPAGSSSSPVTTSRTRGRLTQKGKATPIEARRPASCARSLLPTRSTSSPVRMSSPTAPTCLCGVTGSRTST